MSLSMTAAIRFCKLAKLESQMSLSMTATIRFCKLAKPLSMTATIGFFKLAKPLSMTAAFGALNHCQIAARVCSNLFHFLRSLLKTTSLTSYLQLGYLFELVSFSPLIFSALYF